MTTPKLLHVQLVTSYNTPVLQKIQIFYDIKVWQWATWCFAEPQCLQPPVKKPLSLLYCIILEYSVFTRQTFGEKTHGRNLHLINTAYQGRIFKHLNVITDVLVSAKKYRYWYKWRKCNSDFVTLALSPTRFQTFTFHFLHCQDFSPQKEQL
jgi:hypothetical protein